MRHQLFYNLAHMGSAPEFHTFGKTPFPPGKISIERSLPVSSELEHLEIQAERRGEISVQKTGLAGGFPSRRVYGIKGNIDADMNPNILVLF